jgi:hypothetical protein
MDAALDTEKDLGEFLNLGRIPQFGNNLLYHGD